MSAAERAAAGDVSSPQPVNNDPERPDHLRVVRDDDTNILDGDAAVADTELTVPDDAVSVSELIGEPDDPTVLDRVKAAATRAQGAYGRSVDYWTPPAFWTEDQPSVQKRLDYGRRGGNAPGEGIQRQLMIGWSWFAAYQGAKAVLKMWIFDSPGRTFAWYAVIGMLLLWPTGRDILAAALYLPASAYEWLATH